MTPKVKQVERIYRWAFVAALAALALYLIFHTDMFGFSPWFNELDYSAGWQAESGETVDISQISAGNYGAETVVEKQLPELLFFGDALCFSSSNAFFTVWVDDEAIYSYATAENLTGRGYGIAYHNIPLTLEDAGKTVRIALRGVFSDGKDSRLSKLYICSPNAYSRHLIWERAISYWMSMLVLLFGVLIVAIGLWVPKSAPLPYDLISLGLGAVVFGAWCLVDTGLPQLMTGGMVSYRVLHYLLLPLAQYPTVCFVNSLTRQRRPLYPRLAFWFSGLFLGLMLALRRFAGIDMHELSFLVYASFLLCGALIVAILVDNASYCRKNHLSEDLDFFYIGAACFATAALLDALIYFLNPTFFPTHGTFLRFGQAAFIVEMMLQFLRWWSGEHASIERDRFINKILQIALSANDPEESLRASLDCLGSELHADRAYVFELVGSDTFNLTYEWCRSGIKSGMRMHQGVSGGKIGQQWYWEYKKNGSVILFDVETCRESNEELYNFLVLRGVRSIISAPLEHNGKYIGFFGVDNPPPERMREIAELVRLLSYFLTQLLLQRNEQKRLLHYSFSDSLTGCGNRRALEEFELSTLDPAQPYGVVVCDINGLKATNDTSGHEAGDALITDVSGSLIEVFGASHVFRTGGDEFMAYVCKGSASDFAASVGRLRTLIAKKGRSAAIGAVFRTQGDPNYDSAKADADALMYADKESFYHGRNDRRKH